MNPQEQFLHQTISNDIKSGVAGAALSLKQYLGLQQSYLLDIYGDLGDWKTNLKRYENYVQQHPQEEGVGIVTLLDDIPELTSADLKNWFDAEERDTKLIDELLRSIEALSHSMENNGYDGFAVVDRTSTNDFYHCLELLGVVPILSEDFRNLGMTPLCEWMVNRDDISELLIRDIQKRGQDDRAISGKFHILAQISANICTPGQGFNYDTVTVITQQPRRFYYRGENAFYGSSKAGLFRRGVRTDEQKLIDVLRMDEAGLFLDNFDAVLQWKHKNGTVRYGALMQHYGLRTMFVDITSDLKVALFFACCTPCEDDMEKWRPLRKEEFEHVDSRRSVTERGGDSRYAIIYRDRTEIEYMRYFLGKKRDEKRDYLFANEYKEVVVDEIMPVGYQPFMRGSTQHGYTMLTEDDYDMYRDARFGKFKIRLTEELCNWIYEEMDHGNKVYPVNDVPNIQKYFTKLNEARTFSEINVKNFCDKTKKDYRSLKTYLKQHWYEVKSRTYHISQKEINAINAAYPIEVAEANMDIQPRFNPIIVLTAD